MNHSIVRPMRYADVRSVCDMVADLARDHGDVAAISHTDMMRLCFGKGHALEVFVAQDGASLTGYAAVATHVQLQFGRVWGDLHHLYVKPPARGAGVGSALIKYARDWAIDSGCSALVVGTHPENVLAQRFYQTQGFEARQAAGPRFSMDLARDQRLEEAS